MIYYDNKIFRGRSNTPNGEVSGETIFRYFHTGRHLTGTYSGGTVIDGHLLGTVNEDGSLDFVYHHRNTDGFIQAGKCHSTPTIVDGKIILAEKWQWFTGDRSEGFSEVEQC